MSKISNSSFMKIIMRLIVLFAVAKSLSLALLWYLPKDGVTQGSSKNYGVMYQRVDFKNMLQGTKKGDGVADASVDNGTTINHLTLKAIYGTQKKGFIVVAKKANPLETSIVTLGEQYEGFTLSSLLQQSVMFHKNSEEYVLELETTTPKQQKNEALEHGGSVNVSKEELSFYAKNPEEIWKEIAIVALKEGEEIKGFEVKDIKKGSKFESLGLKKGDILVRVNNVALKSYKDALDIYKNIQNVGTVALIVMRENQEVELVYEVN